MKSGYFGFMMKPSGDFSLLCSYLLGCFGFSFLCTASCSNFCCLDGRDRFGILLYFSWLKTYFWMC